MLARDAGEPISLSARFLLPSQYPTTKNNSMKSKIVSCLLILSVFAIPALYNSNAFAQEAGPGEGLLILTREDRMAGKAIRFNMDINGRQMQLLAGNTIRVPLPVGTHTLSAWSPSLDGQDSVTINVQEGWTYHVEGHIRWGYPAGRAKFKSVSETPPEPGSVPVATKSEPALAGPGLGAVAAPSSAAPVRTAEESGRIGLRNFVGDWDVATWSLAADGSKLEGRGVAEGVLEGDSARITFTEFAAPAFPAATGGGQVRIAYEEGKGFILETWFKHSNEVLKFSGRYEADTGRYVFFMFGSDGEIATGVPRASTRVEVRSTDIATWIADTYSSVEGQSVQVQSYKFTRRSQ